MSSNIPKNRNLFLEWALYYARKHLGPVFPVKPGQKRPPLVKNGLLDATTDEDQIRDWWKKNPRANVAVRTGIGCWVLDQDPDGEETYARLVHEHGRLRDTLEAITPRQGRHYFYLPPANATIPTRAPARDDWKGIDVRGEGGYVLVHPSIVNGKRYEWDGIEGELEPLSEADPWLIEAIVEAHPNGRNTDTTGHFVLPDRIPYHSQHDVLVQYAGQLRAKWLDEDQIFALLWEANLRRCQRPGPEKDIRQYAHSVAQYPPGPGGTRNQKTFKDPPAESPGKPPAEEPAESPVAIPPFPEIAWRGIFAEYRTAMNGTTEASDAAHFTTLWAAVATILGRRVEMYAGDIVYPNVYLAVYGETGDKKTTAQRRIAACNLFEHWPHIRLVRGVGSTEGLADALAESETGVYLLQWEEFATFLSHARWKESTLFEFITECFDCPAEWSKQYRQKPIRLESPTPSILTATTAEWFWKHAKAEDFFGGFGNRFLFFSGPRKDPLANPKPWDGETIAGIKEHLKVIGSANLYRAEWTAPARKVWDAFYVRFENGERSGLLRAAAKRAHIYVRKLAMTYAALEQTLPHIDEDQIQAAIAVIEYGVGSTERLLDLQAATHKPLGEVEHIYLKRLVGHEGLKLRYWQQTMFKHCGDSETFNRMWRNLVQADRIEITPDRRVYLCNS
jgi:hypothetical protein